MKVAAPAHRRRGRPELTGIELLRRSSLCSDRTERRSRRRQLLLRSSSSHRQRHRHRSGHFAHWRHLDLTGERGTLTHSNETGAGAVGQGRHLAHVERKTRISVRRRDGYRRPRCQLAVQLHSRPIRTSWGGHELFAALAATDSERQHAGRLRLDQRRDLARDRHRSSGRVAATVNIGLFVTSPVTFQSTSGGAPTAATATFDHITMNGRATAADWKSTSVGSGPRDYYPTLGASTTRRPDNGVVLSGSGDISLAVNHWLVAMTRRASSGSDSWSH